MAHRLEVSQKVRDGRALSYKNKFLSFGYNVSIVSVVDVYTINKNLKEEELIKIGELLINPVTENVAIGEPTNINNFDWAIEIGFLPGVTDNVAHTVKEEISDLLVMPFSDEEGVYSSKLIFLSGNFERMEVEELALTSYNPLIERAQIKSKEEYKKENGMGILIPKVKLDEGQKVSEVDLNIPDEELAEIGKKGIENPDGTRRGPLALDLPSMKAIRNYFNEKKRKPTDIELEAIAQTWSEHCKHTIFAAEFDKVKDGLYKHYIKRATQEIRDKRGEDDICFSVFTDNSGGIIFDEEYLITDKVETHNSPSALDPFGGAITGIGGVNRDAIGFGMGSKPVVNRYGYCFADPRDESVIYKGKNKTQKMLSARKIMEGVINGVNVGGNCSGIPTPQGFAYFHSDYRGKPLVFVGTVGLIPRERNGKKLWEKKAKPDDLVVVIGGRVGADGIHGATFSSEAMDSGSPATAVQIGDPITQKKLSDAVIKEARDMGLYNSITDNGAGGISCSVAEMAKESGGCEVDLEKVPLKYPGLSPWEIWISESQERMTLSVPKEKWEEFNSLMEKRGVEAAVIGKFTNSGKCIVRHNGEVIMDVEMKFLHDGLPEKRITSEYEKEKQDEPNIKCPDNLQKTVLDMVSRPNLASFEFISTQYDHEVQGGSVLKPLLGPGRVNGSATITRPRLDSKKGVVLSQALYPTYSFIDTYNMAAASIDTAIRNVIAVGGSLKSLALLDNFCWCSSSEKERLGQLKAATRACYDYSVSYGTPFISGKDSMFNDFVGYDKDEKEIKISVPPTLLISSIGVIENVENFIDMFPKNVGDLLYIIGETKEELGGSEYFAYLGEKERAKPYIGNSVPSVDAEKFISYYKKTENLVKNGIFESLYSVGIGGIGAGLSKMAIAARKGIEVDLSNIKTDTKRDDYILFSESQGRFLATIKPENREKFEKEMGDEPYCLIGEITDSSNLEILGIEGAKTAIKIEDLEKSYKETLRSY